MAPDVNQEHGPSSRPPVEGGAQHSAHLAKAVGSVSTAVFASRILGLVREQVFAGLFGAGMAMDAFVVAFRIPNLLRDLFAEGALSSAFVTVFSQYDGTRPQHEVQRLINNVFTAIIGLVSVIVVLGIFFSGRLVGLIAPDFALVPGKLELTATMTAVLFPFLLFVSMAALVMGVLNARGYFFIPAFSSACFNLTSILLGGCLALLFPHWGLPAIVGMALGTLLGGLVQFLIQLPVFRREGFRFRPVVDLLDPGLRRIGRLFLPAVVGLSATQINVFINTFFASQLAEGSVAWLNYAFRLMQLPIGLFGVAISVVSLPVFSKQAAARDYRLLGDTLVTSLVLAMALTIPAAVGLWVLSDPIIHVIFQHGHFSAEDTRMTAMALRFYALGLFAYAAVKIIVPAFYALDDTRWPVIVSCLAVGVNILVILFTMGWLQHRAIALSTSLTVTINFIILGAVLQKKVGGMALGRLGESFVRIVGASGVMGFVIWACRAGLGSLSGSLALGAGLLSTILVGALCYGGILFWLRVPDLEPIWNAVIRRMERRLPALKRLHARRKPDQ